LRSTCWARRHKSLAFTFFRPADVADGKLSGQPYRKAATGAPILTDAPGAVECKVTAVVEQGDHHIIVGEVVEAHLNRPPAGRPDTAVLEMRTSATTCFTVASTAEQVRDFGTIVSCSFGPATCEFWRLASCRSRPVI
jgi:flavin reductase (DIM6/NTAB) family NADH-FMN oxidoreductase RutF